ncbi:MAG: hypothetical protein LBQ71_01575 [Hungatella sp.]|jgi:hypothetical protein|nr:hypothetical protein [Hungatella sp.]
MKLSDFKIKGVSSIVRDRQLNVSILDGMSNLDVVPDKIAKRGDLVLVRVVVENSGYCSLENIFGRSESLYQGADAVADLCDVGVVSSYDDYEIIKTGILRLLSLKKFELMDAFICELGGDFTGGNVNNVLQDKEIMKHVRRIVFNYYDVAGLIAAKTLFSKWKIDLSKVFIAHNIFRNITAINKRLDQWNIPFNSYDVNHLNERINLANDIISEIQ